MFLCNPFISTSKGRKEGEEKRRKGREEGEKLHWGHFTGTKTEENSIAKGDQETPCLVKY